jgi:hypothetical protein
MIFEPATHTHTLGIQTQMILVFQHEQTELFSLPVFKLPVPSTL